jgi:cytochrome c biogenesis protein CcdA
MSSVEQRSTGAYFILGRFIGLVILGLIIASVGLIFDGYMFYMLILFGILTIIFGAVIIAKMYMRIRKQKTDSACTFCNHNSSGKGTETGQSGCSDSGTCSTHDGCSDSHSCQPNGNCFKSFKKTSGSKLTRRSGFLMGIFRGATPCLKIFILAPLLIIVELPVAFLMILIFALASTIYPIIGFLSAKLLTTARKYEPYVQLAGAISLISIGMFMIFKQLLVQSCTFGI